MLLSLNKHNINVLLNAVITRVQELSKSELQLESYVSFTTRAKAWTKS
jgi:hypothetical protein